MMPWREGNLPIRAPRIHRVFDSDVNHLPDKKTIEVSVPCSEGNLDLRINESRICGNSARNSG